MDLEVNYMRLLRLAEGKSKKTKRPLRRAAIDSLIAICGQIPDLFLEDSGRIR
jgi:hypothetical protein